MSTRRTGGTGTTGTDSDTGIDAGRADGHGTRGRRRRPSPQFSVVIVVLAALVAYVGLAGLEQGLRAARGEGVPGVFTVGGITCVQHPGHESCTCNGSFADAGGGEPRAVYLHAAGRDTCEEGARIPAVDAGASNRVYGPDGSREWILSSFVLAACLAVVGGVGVNWVRYLRRTGGAG
ncbi:hypothetical protein HNR06_001098 [Nocardiopsis arvandica]|uniref:DUF3592 domain-containing protein n=1 Tax=Nocardiopsis sinuspersici TaxID=501010 RepID=A0A7Y9X9K7_9ACTN|nr:hypothetical protein [Nocardiopsis sinuspersici]NYH51509.1 hypothetical protein [Nocardiopsis sinuspersici]